jgi:hypothetical protein
MIATMATANRTWGEERIAAELLLKLGPTDTVIVYLRSGDVGGTSLRGPSRVRRGEVDVLPPNTLHQFVNLGFDPIEFIVIYTK